MLKDKLINTSWYKINGNGKRRLVANVSNEIDFDYCD